MPSAMPPSVRRSMSPLRRRMRPGQVARVHGHQVAGGRVDRDEQQRDEARRGRVAQDLDVEALEERRRVEAEIEQRALHGEQQGHQQRRRAALAGHVAQRDDDAGVGQREDVVEVAADRVGRARRAEGLEAAARVEAARQHRLLDVAGDLEVVLERQALEDLEQHEQDEADQREDQPARARRPDGRGQRHAQDDRVEGNPGRAEAVEQREQARAGRR